jgi:hypothetical protein
MARFVGQVVGQGNRSRYRRRRFAACRVLPDAESVGGPAGTPDVPFCAAGWTAMAVVLTCCSAPGRVCSIAGSSTVDSAHRFGCRMRNCVLWGQAWRCPCLLELHAPQPGTFGLLPRQPTFARWVSRETERRSLARLRRLSDVRADAASEPGRATRYFRTCPLPRVRFGDERHIPCPESAAPRNCRTLAPSCGWWNRTVRVVPSLFRSPLPSRHG